MRNSRARVPCLLIAVLAFGAAPLASSTTKDSTRGGFACSTLPEAVERLRAEGHRIAYGAALLSADALVRGEPSAAPLEDGDPELLLREIVAPYGLAVETWSDGTLAIVPGPELDTTDLRRLRRSASPLLDRQESYDALPPWVGSLPGDRRWVELTLPRGADWPAELGAATEYVLIRVVAPETADLDALRFDIQRLVVEARARAARARFGLQAPAGWISRLVDEDLAPYLDGYVATGPEGVPAADETGRVWLRASLGDRPLLELLLGDAGPQPGLVLVDDVEPSPEHLAFLDALRASRAGLLQRQPSIDGRAWSRVFLDPATSRYVLAVYAPDAEPFGLHFTLEPIATVRALFPAGASVDAATYGHTVDLQFDGSSRYWLVELEPGSPARAGGALVEAQAIVDPYEVVVLNQAFRERERSKVFSLDVMEYMTIVPGWRDGARSDWEHRIFHQRGRLDEYLHLGLKLNGTPVPRQKLHKVELWRPIERIELSPFLLENRKTYRYRYLGQEVLGGHPTWKIGFEPIDEGRFVSGVAWIDQDTGAHRRIETAHRGLGAGIVSGSYTTDFGFVADGADCYWDWRSRHGSEAVDYLDFAGSYAVEYRRDGFRYNRSDFQEVVRAAHESDVLIHVATPPEGHRWLLRGEEIRPQRGDQPYGAAGVLRESPVVEGQSGQPGQSGQTAPCLPGDCPVASQTRLERPDLVGAEAASDGVAEVLAGIHAFPSRSRVTTGLVGGSGEAHTDWRTSASYVNLDFLGRGRRGRGELYLRLLGYDEGAAIALTDPAMGQTGWSWTTSVDLELDPETDFLFQPVGGFAQTRDMSLDVRRSALRFSFSRPLSDEVLARVRYGLHDLRVDRLDDTDPAFVLPVSTLEHSLGWELEWSRRSWSAELGLEGVWREEWKEWGLDGAEEPEDELARAWGRVSTVHPLGRSQAFGATLGVFGGSHLDRFSRPRLSQLEAWVPGFSPSLTIDSGAHAALTYNFRVGPLPFRARVDAARLARGLPAVGDDDRKEDVLDPEGSATPSSPNAGAREYQSSPQDLLGARLDLIVHGPFATDWTFGVSRGLHAEPALGPFATYWWVFLSRRFGE